MSVYLRFILLIMDIERIWGGALSCPFDFSQAINCMYLPYESQLIGSSNVCSITIPKNTEPNFTGSVYKHLISLSCVLFD